MQDKEKNSSLEKTRGREKDSEQNPIESQEKRVKLENLVKRVKK